MEPVERMRRADRVADVLGMDVLESAGGRATVRMRISADMVNGHHIAHGGYVFLLADTAFAYACNSHGPVTVAASADVDFITPAFEGDLLVATATERTRFARSGIYDVTVRRGDEVVAEFRGRSRSMRGPGAAGNSPDTGPAAQQSGASDVQRHPARPD